LIGQIQQFFTEIINFIAPRGAADILRAVVDISIVSYVVYKLIILVKETRAVQLIKGILIILVATQVSGWLELKTIKFILDNTISYGVIALLIVFQPELRRGLEQIGRSKFQFLFSFDEEREDLEISVCIEEVVKSVAGMARTFTGALIVIERDTKLGEVIKTGVQMESIITSELLINVFTPNTPLHDGAVILRGSKIKASACFLPLTDNQNLSKELGTRHRAALGITEISDAVAIVVSEETGKISIAREGGLTRNINTDTLRKALNKYLMEDNKPNARKLSLWKGKNK
jgi:diadenylate cyclase